VSDRKGSILLQRIWGQLIWNWLLFIACGYNDPFRRHHTGEGMCALL